MTATARPQPNGGALDSLMAELEELDLSPYESRVLTALLRLGSATSAELARNSKVPRTSIYSVVEALSAKGLCQRLPVSGSARWSTPGRDEVLDRLYAFEEERLRHQRERVERVREILAESFPEAPSSAGAYVHVMHGAAQVNVIYNRMLAEIESELLFFNRPPYSSEPGHVNPLVLAALERGIEARVLYQAEQWNAPECKQFREGMRVYHDAGVQGALVDDLPMKLAVADRRVALVSMTDPTALDIGFPTTLLVEHPGYASVQALAFDRLWETAHPIKTTDADTRSQRPGVDPSKPVEPRRRRSDRHPAASKLSSRGQSAAG